MVVMFMFKDECQLFNIEENTSDLKMSRGKLSGRKNVMMSIKHQMPVNAAFHSLKYLQVQNLSFLATFSISFLDNAIKNYPILF